MEITAIILAGGKSSRMGNKDKAWMEYENIPLILRVINRIAPDVADIIISRNRQDTLYEDLPYACYADNDNEHRGPLSGIASCLEHVRTDYTLVVPCDIPNLPANLVRQLLQLMSDYPDSVVVAHDGNRIQPLVFLAATEQLSSITDYLQSGRRSVMGWLESREYRLAHFPGDSVSFENINEPDQLR